VNLSITDPKALDNARKDLSDLHRPGAPAIVYEDDPYAAAKDADAILLMTDWRDYPALDWARLYASMRKPALVFDTRNCLDAAALRALGFTVLNVGK
jgi:UDPglucose 6-dehydrogenase